MAHAAIALFIAGGFVLIPIGAALGWRWIRDRAYRIAHLGGIAFVAAESVAGVACPLTVWEDMLRGRAGQRRGFVERWVGGLLYWDLPWWVFTALYCLAAALAVLMWRAIPPRARQCVPR